MIFNNNNNNGKYSEFNKMSNEENNNFILKNVELKKNVIIKLIIKDKNY